MSSIDVRAKRWDEIQRAQKLERRKKSRKTSYRNKMVDSKKYQEKENIKSKIKTALDEMK